MMKKYFLLLAAGLFALTSGLYGQSVSPVCGMTADDQLEMYPRLLSNLDAAANAPASTERAIQYVPIHFHRVGDNTGAGKIREARILDQLCLLNQQYAPLEIQFYLSPHPQHGLFNATINSDNVYNNQSNFFLMENRRHNNALNVYLVEEASSGNNSPGLVLAYYSPSRDWVVSRKDQINNSTDNSTLAHEVGHFFSLMHPFWGYESNPFDPTDPTWPKAPVTSPDGRPTERQDGTNCTTAGDGICDTPPDYNFGSLTTGCNAYTAGAQDPLGVPVNPQENNYMSYFFDCSSYQFTPQQITAIKADLNSFQRNYLDNSFVPAATSITTPMDLLIFPAQNEVTTYYNSIPLQWKSVAGATHYLLETDIIPVFTSPSARTFVLTDTSTIVSHFEANKTYYWRVRPFNQYATCAVPRQRTLKTSAVSAVPELEGINAWVVAPNPAGATDNVRIMVQSEQQLEANLAVYTASGQRVITRQALSLPAGEHNMELPTAGLAAGLYFVVLENNSGRSVRKLAINR